MDTPLRDRDCGHAAGVLTVAMDAKGKTLYGRMGEGKFLLGPGPQDTSTKKTRRMPHRVPLNCLGSGTVTASQGSPTHGANGVRASHGERYTSKVCRQELGSSRGGLKNSEAPILRSRIEASRFPTT